MDERYKILSDSLAEEFNKQEGCDVMFIVGGQTIGAHKFMLKVMQARCQALREIAMTWNHGDEPISIEDVDYESFKALLRYIYTDDITISNDNVFVLLSAAVTFRMTHCEQACVDHISELMCIENVCFYMNEAMNFKSAALQEKCKQMFSENTSAVLDDSFFDLSQPSLSSFLDIENANAVEIELFYSIEFWMKKQCQTLKLPINGANMRKTIGDALYKIRFPTMSLQDFANTVTTIRGLLTESEMAQVFQKITIFDSQGINCTFSEKFRCTYNHRVVEYKDFKALFEANTLYNTDLEPNCDLKSMISYVKNVCENERISLKNVGLLLQCCVDLANTCTLGENAAPENQEIRNELFNAFEAWEGAINLKTENFQHTMSKYKELRTKLNRLCLWTLN